MTSQLNVDTIVDKAGSGGTNVKVANTSTTMYLMVVMLHRICQGLAKDGIIHNQANSVEESLNHIH